MTHTPCELLFIGTGAADWPDTGGGTEHRAHASLLIDGRLLIDCTHSALARMRQWGLRTEAISDVLITHGHDDHFQPDALQALAAARPPGSKPLRVHLHTALAGLVAGAALQALPLEPGQTVSAAGYTIQTLCANHPAQYPGEQPLHYLLAGRGVRLLYATDGAWLPYPIWEALQGHPLDALIIDATVGDGHDGDARVFGHNSLAMIRIMIDALRTHGELTPRAPVILTHLARTLHLPHAQLQAALPAPYLAAYDGLTCTLPAG